MANRRAPAVARTTASPVSARPRASARGFHLDWRFTMRQPATTAGRKRATPKRENKQKLEAIEASGLTPLDYLLSVMRNPKAKAALRFVAAREAAAYIHPPVAPIDSAVARLLGTLLTGIVKSHAGPAEQ